MSKVVILAGEVSGDHLGAALMRQIKSNCNNGAIDFIGVGGHNMIREGLESWLDIEHLSVMGLDVLRQLPKLLRLRSDLIKRLCQLKPDLVIGIDAPDFNFAVEKRLKAHGIPVWHWVSPSVWAWRQGRIKKIGTYCDEVLCLFPQEPKLYHKHSVKANFYGHPMADEIPLDTHVSQTQFTQKLIQSHPNLEKWHDKKTIALLPGSRWGEIKYMVPLFFKVACKLMQSDSQLRFILPIAKPSLNDYCHKHHQMLTSDQCDKIIMLNGHARECINFSTIVLLASGTATLEVMLLKKPMLVAHQSSFLNCLLLKLFLLTPYVSLPNFMANSMLVDELLCGAATVENVYTQLNALLNNTQKQKEQTDVFASHHEILKQDAVKQVAQKVLNQLAPPTP